MLKLDNLKKEEVLLNLFNKSDAVLFQWKNNDNWDVEYVSTSVKKLLGYNKQKFLNKKVHYRDIIHPDDLLRVQGEVTSAIKNNKDFFQHITYRVITKNNTTKWVDDNTLIIKNKKGKVKYSTFAHRKS